MVFSSRTHQRARELRPTPSLPSPFHSISLFPPVTLAERGKSHLPSRGYRVNNFSLSKPHLNPATYLSALLFRAREISLGELSYFYFLFSRSAKQKGGGRMAGCRSGASEEGSSCKAHCYSDTGQNRSVLTPPSASCWTLAHFNMEKHKKVWPTKKKITQLTNNPLYLLRFSG